MRPLERIRRVGGLVLVLLLTGTVGYRFLCHLSWLDAFYFTVITMSTVGYREVGELDPVGKVFTIALIFSGVGVLAYSVSTTLELLLDEQHRTYFTTLLNRRRSRLMEQHYIVCGLGRVGRAVCQELADSKTPFLVIDSNPEKVQSAISHGWTSLLGDASEGKVLQQANITRARGLV